MQTETHMARMSTPADRLGRLHAATLNLAAVASAHVAMYPDCPDNLRAAAAAYDAALRDSTTAALRDSGAGVGGSE